MRVMLQTPDLTEADYEIEFYAEESGREPCRQWIDKLDHQKKVTVLYVIEQLLQRLGPDICETEFAKILARDSTNFESDESSLLKTR